MRLSLTLGMGFPNGEEVLGIELPKANGFAEGGGCEEDEEKGEEVDVPPPGAPNFARLLCVALPDSVGGAGNFRLFSLPKGDGLEVWFGGDCAELEDIGGEGEGDFRFLPLLGSSKGDGSAGGGVWLLAELAEEGEAFSRSTSSLNFSISASNSSCRFLEQVFKFFNSPFVFKISTLSSRWTCSADVFTLSISSFNLKTSTF